MKICGENWEGLGARVRSLGLFRPGHLFVHPLIRPLLSICYVLNTAKCCGLGFRK